MEEDLILCSSSIILEAVESFLPAEDKFLQFHKNAKWELETQNSYSYSYC